jgi:hypothetical protein
MFKPSKAMIPAIVVLVGAVITAIGAFWIALKSENDRTLFERELRDRGDKLTKVQEELKAKSDEVAELNRNIAASVTGGDSFCYFTFNFDSNGGRPIVIQQGKYPLYEVNVRVVDLDKWDAVEEQSKKGGGAPSALETMKSSETLFDIGNMGPHEARVMNAFVPFPPNKEKLRFNIFINARNGWFTELLRVYKVNGEWRPAIKVTKDNISDTGPDGEPITLMEMIDPALKGKIDWEN